MIFLSPYKVGMNIVMLKQLLFTHPADTEQRYRPTGAVLYLSSLSWFGLHQILRKYLALYLLVSNCMCVLFGVGNPMGSLEIVCWKQISAAVEKAKKNQTVNLT